MRICVRYVSVMQAETLSEFKRPGSKSHKSSSYRSDYGARRGTIKEDDEVCCVVILGEVQRLT